MKSIYALSPINKTAAVVVSSGSHYQPDCKVQEGFSELPLETISPAAAGVKPGHDITGIRSGRLVAVGVSANHKGRWVCRCDCGNYVIRRAKAMKNPENYGDRCEHCRHLAYIKRSEIFRRTGKDVDVRSL